MPKSSAPVRAIVRAIESVLPARRPIEHHEPSIGDREICNATMCLRSGTFNEAWQKDVEDELRICCGVEQAVAVSSGTAALHLILLALEIKPNEEVLVPSLTFVATANAVRYVGAVPNFIDGTICVNAYKLRRYLETETEQTSDRRGRRNLKTGRVISALIVVDLLGFPADFTKLTPLASEYGLVLIEDAAQALGSMSGNQACGSYGAASALSFNNNKIVTGNGGGAVLTNDPWLAAKIHQLATTARKPHAWFIEHDAVAYNYRMPSINAAILLGQLDRLDQILKNKKSIYQKYRSALNDLGIEVLSPQDGAANNWLVTMKVADCSQRDELLTELHAVGIRARAMFTPLHMLEPFAEFPYNINMEYSENSFKTHVCLPSGPGLVQ